MINNKNLPLDVIFNYSRGVCDLDYIINYLKKPYLIPDRDFFDRFWITSGTGCDLLDNHISKYYLILNSDCFCKFSPVIEKQVYENCQSSDNIIDITRNLLNQDVILVTGIKDRPQYVTDYFNFNLKLTKHCSYLTAIPLDKVAEQFYFFGEENFRLLFGPIKDYRPNTYEIMDELENITNKYKNTND